MRYKVSSFGLVVFRTDGAVWDDVLYHKQIRLTSEMLQALSHYSGPSPHEDSEFEEPLTQSEAHVRLVEHNVLIADGSDRAEQESQILQGWGSWITLARLFHFSTRITMSDEVLTTEQSTQLAVERREQSAPPDRFSAPLDDSVIPLPQTYEFDGSDTALLDVLESRRTCRRFIDESIDISLLASVLSASARVSRSRPHSARDRSFGNIFRNSPSGGARASTEVYIQARKVLGLAPGNYRYLPTTHALQLVSAISTDAEMLTTMSGQSWFLDSAVILVLVGNIERYSWKYTDKRSYPSMLIDAGHLSQNICLVSTALGLGIALTGVQRDEAIEREFRIDSSREIVVLASAIGVPEFDDVVLNSYPQEYNLANLP